MRTYGSWMKKITSPKKLGLLATVIGAAALGACSGGDAQVGPKDIVAQSQGLTSGAVLEALNGRYINCLQRVAPNDVWSARINGFAGTLTNPDLTVVKLDPTCTLQAESIVVDGNSYDLDVPWTLGASYLSTPIKVKASLLGEALMYINGYMLPADFSADFIVYLKYAGDVTLVTPTINSSFSIVNGSVSASAVQVPSYAMTPFGTSVQVDATDHITSALGSLAFDVSGPTLQGAQKYAVVESIPGLDTDYNAVSNAFQSASQVAIGGNFTIALSTMNLVGKSITPAYGYTTRVLVANTDADSGSTSFQQFKITIRHPTNPGP